MATELVPIALGLSKHDVVTLWAPPWRAADGDEYQAFLGLGEDLYGFENTVNLIAYARSNTPNDLDDHPVWPEVAEWDEIRFEPTEPHSYDLVGVFEIAAGSPTEESVQELDDALAIAKAIAEVCDLDKAQSFFTDEPLLELVSGGIDNFYDREGLKTWTRIGKHIAKKWDKVLDEIEGVIAIPELDTDPAEREEIEQALATQLADAHKHAAQIEAEEARAAAREAGDLWERAGIDPIVIITPDRSWYTLRCYIGDTPLFLGAHKRIFAFKSPRALGRYLVDDHAHALAELSTWEQVQLAATDGAIDIDVDPENTYDLTGVVDAIAGELSRVDAERLELAQELIQDVADFTDDETLAGGFAAETGLGIWAAAVLGSQAEEDTAVVPATAAEAPAETAASGSAKAEGEAVDAAATDAAGAAAAATTAAADELATDPASDTTAAATDAESESDSESETNGRSWREPTTTELTTAIKEWNSITDALENYLEEK